jgi:hypothetical protein
MVLREAECFHFSISLDIPRLAFKLSESELPEVDV